MAEASGACVGQGDETGPVGSEYDVFLSFRGPDTRYSITDCLYEFMIEKGIRVFRDDNEIRRGEEIGDELERAIRGSRVYVVVFSRGYASSAWCLRELAMMVDCLGDSASGKVILPIFYNVDPHDVRLGTDLYRGALDKHRERYGEEGVKSWGEALVKVGGISGWDYKCDMGVGKFIRNVVQNVLRYLKIRDRSLPQYLIGMDDCVDCAMTMLKCESPDVRVVTLHGMGGIGKTTLANAIFNKISSEFDRRSFLANVRGSSTSEGGVIKLQKKLLGDVLGHRDSEIGDSNDGKNQINRWIRGKRVLIIFDDVSEGRQLDELVGTCDFFGPGTRIIITTRDRCVCKGLSSNIVVDTYEMKVMRDDHALQLFSRHAFGCEEPPDDFVALSKQAIRTTGNLPLALEVIGGLLFGLKKNEWEYTLEKLERVPDERVMEILRISYDSLGEREKQIFLDIACFSEIEMPREYASYMWETCGYYPKIGLDVLQNRSLIKVLNVHDDDYRKDKYWMHDLIREMGREIVRSEFPLHSPGVRSRLWDPEEALNVVLQKEGTHHVLAIHLGLSGHSFTGEQLEGMSNLRFLYLSGTQLIGDFMNFRRKPLWLRWDFCGSVPNPGFFKMDKLVILQVSWDGVTDKSMEDLRMGNLRVLEVKDADITRMPDLSLCSKLELINLQHCNDLEELHSSIGELGDLKCLKIEYFDKLRRLPEEIGSAKALQELILMDCGSIKELPESIASLGELRILRGIRTKIRKLPSSIGNLQILEVLEIENHPWVPPPSEASNLARCNLSGLSYLRSLTLSGLVELGELLGMEKLRGLQKLNLHCGDISSISQLPSSLRELTLEGYPRENFWWSETGVDVLDNVGNLCYLTLKDCMDVRLSDFASLRRLCSLHLEECKWIDFSGVERMELLEELIVWCCDDFRGGIPNLSNLRRMKRMEFFGCSGLQILPSVVGDCHLKVDFCDNFDSFTGPYRQYHNKKRKRELEVELDYRDDIGDGKFVRVVIQDALRYQDRSLPQYLIGMDDRVESVLTMMECESPDVRVVMLHGMGGIGKTTLANAIFNKICSQFDRCSFLANVRESSTGEGGVIKLQKKLLGDILGRWDSEIGDSNDGKNRIDRWLRGKRVLIIFDDVSERRQLYELVGTCDFFGLGTRIIITTRDKSVCKGFSRNSVVYTYEMEGMRDDHALQLFNWHAFGREVPQDDFVALSKQVIGMTGNLPLALEVMGGHLFSESKEVWLEILKKLERVPEKDVMKILWITYDGLEETEKQIFLDIACFSEVKMPRKYGSYMWEACGYYPKCGLDVLHNRSLIKVLDDDVDDYKDKYWMHDLIREMGREIVRSECPLHCPGMRTRLWDRKEARNVIRQKQGTHHVLAMDLGVVEDRFTGEEIEVMSNLRFLSLFGGQLIGEFRKLLWLHWDWCRSVPNPGFFKMDNLVILQISGDRVTNKSMDDLRMGNLRVLDINKMMITRMPNISHCSKLELINLQRCYKLEELHSSIGELRDLKCLKIAHCYKLTRLPEELGSAKALQELILMDCGSIKELPESIGSLGDLRILRGFGTGIRKLPSSIGNLKSLEVLEIESDLRALPSSEVSNLERCNLSGLFSLLSLHLSGLDEPWELLGMEKLRGLQKLKLDVGGGKQLLLSTQLGSLTRLEELYLHCGDISSISQLPSSLRKLTLEGNPRDNFVLSETWVDGLDIVGNLNYLTLLWCMDVRLSALASLRRLCSLHLSNCQRIDFSGVERMELLEELIIFGCYSMNTIPDLSNLRRMKRMEFNICSDLQSVPRVVGDCHLKVDFCDNLYSFTGPYRQYHNKKGKRELEVELCPPPQ